MKENLNLFIRRQRAGILDTAVPKLNGYVIEDTPILRQSTLVQSARTIEKFSHVRLLRVRKIGTLKFFAVIL